jgi:(E)-2-((N-methylformamido)methylene)succinate hydrolase
MKLNYRAEGSGPPVVLLHGVGGDASNWDGIAPQLAARFRVIRIDLRGHGGSGPIEHPCRIEDFADDVMKVLDELGVSACPLVGFSLGGMVAQSVALDSPQRVGKLALISTSAGRTDAERARVASRLGDLQTRGVAAVAPLNREVWFTEAFQKAHPEKVEARVRQLLESDPASYLQAYAVFATTDLGEWLSAIRVPTLIITGEHDVSGTPRMARLMHERIWNSNLRILPGLRHSLLIEAPEEVADLLMDFL